MPNPNTTTLTDANGNEVTFYTTPHEAAGGDIPYIEHLDYGEKFTNDGAQEATRTLSCLWSQRHKFRQSILGASKWQSGITICNLLTNLSRTPPDRHPEDELGHLWASEMDLVEGRGVPPTDTSDLCKALTSVVDYTDASAAMVDKKTGLVKFSLATYKVRYTARPYDLVSDTDASQTATTGELGRGWIERRPQLASEAVQIPGGGFIYVGSSPPAKVMEPGIIVLGTAKLTWIFYEVPYYRALLYECLSRQGMINSKQLDGVWPAGTCLLTSVEPTRVYRNVFGKQVADVTITADYRNVGTMDDSGAKGWNFYPRLNGQWTEISTTGLAYPEPAPGSVHVYNSTDLNQCFTLPTFALTNVPP